MPWTLIRAFIQGICGDDFLVATDSCFSKLGIRPLALGYDRECPVVIDNPEGCFPSPKVKGPVPELRRVPLEEVVLQLYALRPAALSTRR